MMGRPPRIDPDINWGGIKSNIIRELTHRMDSFFAGDGGVDQYVFCDIQNRFVVALTDDCCFYESNGYGIRVPVLKFIYVPQHHRERGIQKMFLEYITSVADEVGESFAGFASAFDVIDPPIRGQAVEYMDCVLQNEGKYLEDWLYKTAKQRKRMMDLGFRNVKYEDGVSTEPWQQLYYQNEKATAEEKMIVDSLELHYDVKWQNIDQTA